MPAMSNLQARGHRFLIVASIPRLKGDKHESYLRSALERRPYRRAIDMPTLRATRRRIWGDVLTCDASNNRHAR